MLLSSAPLICSSQSIDGIALTPAGRIRIADSLRMLPQVRREAAAWRLTAYGYQAEARAWQTADSLHLAAVRSGAVVSGNLNALLASQAAETADWRHRARTSGFLNYTLAAGIAALTYLFITH